MDKISKVKTAGLRSCEVRAMSFAVSKSVLILCVIAGASGAAAQSQSAPPRTGPQPGPPTHANILRGEYGRYRANNDLLYYHLDVRVDPEKKYLSGKVTTRFKMLQDDTRIQLDLHEALKIDKILF